MFQPGKKAQDHHQKPTSVERWLVGALAGGVLVYVLGKAMGLGAKKSPSSCSRDFP